jgi:N-acyl-D-amino-acid deacylase
MLRDLEEGLEAGLAGLSAGLAYPASLGAPASEAAALARAAFRRGKVFALHIRNEYEGMWEALDEAFAIAREALGGSPRPGARLVLSHQKCAGPANRGRSAELLERIERAARDIPLAFDAYPYEAGSTLLEPESVRASRRVLVTWSGPHPELAGLELAEAASRLGLGTEAAIGELSPAGAAYFHMEESDVEAILAHPLCMVGSDGLPNDAKPHPRLYGTFPRYLARFVRERRLLSLEEAVRKASSLPASVFGLPGGGMLAAGAPADLVVFRPEAIEAGSDWTEPRRAARGIDLVLVGGVPALGGARLR